MEDEPSVRRYVSDALSRFGYQTTVAETPTEALELVAKAAPTFNLLFTDVVLPEMSGMHLAQRATKLRPGLRVVFMSGHIDLRAGHAALPQGPSSCASPFPRTSSRAWCAWGSTPRERPGRRSGTGDGAD